MFWAVFRLASVFGLGATIERWFGPGDESPDTGVSITRFLRLIVIAAIVYVVYLALGKKIKIGK
jgi:hypothetical protein